MPGRLDMALYLPCVRSSEGLGIKQIPESSRLDNLAVVATAAGAINVVPRMSTARGLAVIAFPRDSKPDQKPGQVAAESRAPAIR